MKDFTRPRGRLRSLPLPARVVYSVFLVFTLLALALTAWLGQQMVGLDLSRIDAYYAGGAEPSSAQHGSSAPPAGGGPQLDLPAEADAPVVSEPMPLRKLLEVTHFHLFSMPVYLLILSHLFMLSRARDATKLGWIALGTLAVALHIAAPWLARGGGAAAHWLYGVSGAALAASFLVMAIGPLVEMWTEPRERGASEALD
jgi:hypothetical protein